MTVLPLVRAPQSSDASFEELVKEDNEKGFRKECYSNEEFRVTMQDLILCYDANGLLD